jgi:putative peptidoglycan lipid II flippase
MNKILDRTRQLIFAQQTSILSSTIIIAAMIVVARIFGFMRHRVLTNFYVKEELDIFYSAFRIPDLIFEILITGALTASFIPFYIKHIGNKKLQDEYISSIINIVTLFLVVFIFIFSLFLHPIIAFITPGYDDAKIQQITFFAQLLLLGQLPFLALGNFLTGISQAKKMFLLPALAPIIYNVGIIVATLAFAKSMYLLAPIIGVIGGAVLFLLIQLPVVKMAHFQYHLVIRKAKELMDFFKVVIPRIFTVAIAQIDATVDLSLTSLLGAGSYTVFYYAQHLQLLPVSVVGIAFGQASLPYLSEMWKEKKMEEFKRIIVDSILNLFFFAIPITAFFIFARTPLVRLFYGGQKFDWDGTIMTAFTLSYFALSVPAHTIYYFLTRCFYAFFDSKTPFYISLFSLSLNMAMSLFFILVLKLPVWSLAISFSMSMIVNVVLLMVILYIKINGYDTKTLFIETFKICLATLLSSIFVYYVLRLFDNLIFDTTRTINVFFLMVTMGMLYLSTYLFLAWVFDIREAYLITRMFLKVKEYQKKIVEFYSQVS